MSGCLIGEASGLREGDTVPDSGTWLLRMPGLMGGGQAPAWDDLVRSV